MSKYTEEVSKYSEKRKYQVAKEAMMQNISSTSVDYPKLQAKGQEDMMRNSYCHTTQVEGAQGKLILRLSNLYREWQDDTW